VLAFRATVYVVADGAALGLLVRSTHSTVRSTHSTVRSSSLLTDTV
jgi:hypothetical protein